uniref:CCR4-NOT transcription complex subunit 3 n=1 Tax=Anthurium amnicola TaxID=1678845 RepID=A0A1D1XR52_9ARAE
MGASRKLQGEIDRVLKKVQEGVDIFDSIWNKVYDTENANQKEKFEADLKKEIKKLQRYRDQIKSWIQSSEIKDKKVSASYEQALMDARKQIEREMERFKVCEKETKTKAFSKEGLGQQPKTDPKEKAKSETRDWLNTVVGDLESQIDNFEAEIEGLSVKKGKTKPNRLTHLETSITRHKTHIMKLEWILRLLDNDELSTEQVNDVKEFLEDYVERNQEDFDDFSDPDELYSALPLDKVESLEDFVAIGTSGLVKVAVASVVQQSASSQEQAEETASQDSNSEIVPRTPPSKSALVGSVSAASLSISSNAQPGSNSVAATGIASARSLTGGSTAAAILSGPSPILGVIENPASGAPSSVSNISSSAKEDDNISFLGRRSSPAPIEIGLGRGIVRGPMVGGLINQGSTSVSMPLGSIGGVSTSAALGAVPAVSDVAKRNILGADERVGAGLSQPLVSPLSSRMVSQVSRANDGSTDSNNVAEGPVIGRVFSPSVVSGVQWRPQTVTAFQNQNETFRGRTEIAPDQREKFLQRLQQVQQQGPSNLLNVPHLPGGHKQFPTQQQNSLLQQLNSQTSNLPSQVGIGLGIQTPGLATISPTSQQPISMNQQSSQHALLSAGSKDADVGHMKIDEQLQQQNLSDDLNAESALSSGLKQNIANEDDLKSPYMSAGATSTAEVNQVPRDIDLSPGQPLQLTQSSASLGVIGRRSVPDLGAIVDNISIANPGVVHDHAYNLQMLEAAYFKLPQPKDSERVKNYIPRKPAVTPASYPQMQAPVVDNPAFWDRLGIENMTDILFFAFYYQQNTYQQYLAAKELKKQSWRYHRKYNTWFQRHEEPKVTNDDFEQGTYVYFDFNITEDNHGWCQRIKTEFTFEYTYLEDELV